MKISISGRGSSIFESKLTLKSFFKEMFTDTSLQVLLLTNFATILFAVLQNWDLLMLLWVYWFQSVTIGLFNFVRILQLKEFSTEGLEINGQSVEPTEKVKKRWLFSLRPTTVSSIYYTHSFYFLV